MQIRLTTTRLRSELFSTLDHVVNSGDSFEVQRHGGLVRIICDTSTRRLAALQTHPCTINGDADELASLSWEQSWQPRL